MELSVDGSTEFTLVLRGLSAPIPEGIMRTHPLTQGATMSGTPGNVTLGILLLLEAKPGKEADVQAFLEGGLGIVNDEPGTITWYAFQAGPSTFGVFDTFETEEARQAHLTGRIPEALGQVAGDLLAAAPDLRQVDLLAAK